MGEVEKLTLGTEVCAALLINSCLVPLQFLHRDSSSAQNDASDYTMPTYIQKGVHDLCMCAV